MKDIPVLIEGGLAVDDRGCVLFSNGFAFEGVKRFYAVENFSKDTIRAWHGHEKEGKYVFVSSGSAIVAAVKMTDTKKPNKKEKIERYILSSRKPSVLWIPSGYANGFKSLEPGTKLFFFSTSTLEESKGDDYRFPADYWGDIIWHVENR